MNSSRRTLSPPTHGNCVEGVFGIVVLLSNEEAVRRVVAKKIAVATSSSEEIMRDGLVSVTT